MNDEQKRRFVEVGDCFIQCNPILTMQLMKVHAIRRRMSLELYDVTIVYFSCGIEVEEHVVLTEEGFDMAHYCHIGEDIYQKGLKLALVMEAAVRALPDDAPDLEERAASLQDRAESEIVALLDAHDLLDSEDFEYDKYEYHPESYPKRTEALLRRLHKIT